MTPLRIVMNVEETPLYDDFGDKPLLVRMEAIGALPQGTVGGKPTVAVAARDEDGRVLMFETTLELLTAAVNALNARHGG